MVFATGPSASSELRNGRGDGFDVRAGDLVVVSPVSGTVDTQFLV